MSNVLPIKQADQEAAAIGALYRLARKGPADSAHYLIDIGQKLVEQKTSLSHGQWLPWLKKNAEILGISTARTAERLLQLGIKKFDVNRDFTDEEAISICNAIWGNERAPRGTTGTGENEWFTPAQYVERARNVLGAIDLDPASNPIAQKTIRAARFFTKEDDGLRHEWSGRVWLNPPYAQPWIAKFVAKLVAERRAEHVEAAILLTHNYTDTAWFHEAAEAADAICFTRGRIGFYDPDGVIAAPTQGQAFSYFGRDIDLFERTFHDVGFVVPAWRWIK